MILHDVVPTLQQQEQLRSTFYHVVRSLLLDNLKGLSGNTPWVKRIRKKTAAKKLTIRQVDGASEKTDFYPLPALDEEEASVKGTIRVAQALIRNILGFTTETAASALWFFVGDCQGHSTPYSLPGLSALLHSPYRPLLGH